jgi:acyl-coenzyme A thioesterase PaaI-like protein
VRRLLPALTVAGLLTAVALAFWQRRMVEAVPGTHEIPRWSADLYEQYIPVWTYAYRGSRLLPWWNPYQLAGVPFVATFGIGGLLYPASWLATVIRVPLAMGYACAAHVALAGLLTLACGRALGLSWPGAALAGVGFMLDTSFLAERTHPSYLFGLAYAHGAPTAAPGLPGASPPGHSLRTVPAPEDVELTFPEEGGCFGCSPANPSGLQLRFRRRGDRVTARYIIDDRFHGAPGIAHGGIAATILDEASCAAVVFLADRHVVTGELLVRYERPCPVDVPLDIVASIIDRGHARYWVIDAEIHHNGTPVARSSGKFFLRDDAPVAP